MQTIDISRYLKKGENIIAVWYAPGRIRNKSKQLSLELHGWYTALFLFIIKQTKHGGANP